MLNIASQKGLEEMADVMRKCGNVTLYACDKADDAKYSFQEGAISDG